MTVVPGTENESIGYFSTLLLTNSSGLILNTLSVIMFIKSRNELLLSSNNNKFLFSLAIGDLLVSLFGVIGAILFYLLMNGHVSVSSWKLAGILPLFGSFFISILALGVMTLDKIAAVLYHLRYNSIMTNLRINLLIAITWLIPLSILFIQASLFFCMSPDVERKVRGYLLATFFAVGAITLVLANNKLYWIILRKRREISILCKDVNISQVDFQMNRRSKLNTLRLAKTNFSYSLICIWMTAIFIVCWLPITVFYLVLASGYPGSRTVSTIVMSLASINSLLNPLIYLMKRKDFRRRFGKFS